MLYSETQSYDGFKDHCIGTQLKYVLIPKTCHISGKRIWFEKAYRQTAMWTGPGEPAFDYRWYNKDEFLVAKLKGLL